MKLLISDLSIVATSLGLEFKLLIAGGWIAFLLLLVEIANRQLGPGSEIPRKILHIGAGHVVLLAWWLQIPAWVGISAAIVAAAIALLSYRLPILTSINGIGRHSWGTFFYAVSIGVLVAWFWPLQQPQFAAIGILVMTWGDGLAALVGQRFGRHPYKLGGIQKSWEGSLTMILASYLVCAGVLFGIQANTLELSIIPPLVAILATLLEAFSKFGVDNLTVPLSSAALAFVLCSVY